MIHVIATIKVTPGRRDEFLAAFAAVTPLVEAEEGCLEYCATVDEPTSIDRQAAAGDDAVVVVEKWQSVAALEAHLAAPHMNDFRVKTDGVMLDVHLLVLKPA